ncbi:MAG: protocatechuate 3,4-dioxygenase subunit alpha [Proteobacteria bacterium]|nr:protocatechuate 3,4-dioxygenase subunit alpha [Pseudomonadota bacterium]
MSTRVPTANFTIGPFFPTHFVDTGCNDLTRVGERAARGPHVLLAGRVLEQAGAATANTIVEIWQPDANGLFAHPLDPRGKDADPNFLGWGRAATDRDGWYRFRTIMPGRRVYNDGRARLPHINLMLIASGLMRRLTTTILFADDPNAADDPVLDGIADATARRRLFARREPALDDGDAKAYRFDVILRGADETPFFAD